MAAGRHRQLLQIRDRIVESINRELQQVNEVPDHDDDFVTEFQHFRRIGRRKRRTGRTYKINVTLVPTGWVRYRRNNSECIKKSVIFSLTGDASTFRNTLDEAFPSICGKDIQLLRLRNVRHNRDRHMLFDKLPLTIKTAVDLKSSFLLNRSCLYIQVTCAAESNGHEEDNAPSQGNDRGEVNTQEPAMDMEPNQVPVPVPSQVRPRCASGLHTLATEDEVCLLCQQDAAYRDTLIADRMTQEERETSREDHQRREIERIQTQRLTELRRRRQELLPPEIQDGFPIRIRTGNRLLTRRFTLNDDIQVLMNFVGSCEDASEFFYLYSPVTPRISSAATGTLQNHNITAALTLSATWAELENDDIIISDDEHEETPPRHTTMRQDPHSNVQYRIPPRGHGSSHSLELADVINRLRSIVIEEEPYINFHLNRSEVMFQALEEMDNYESNSECLHALRVIFVDKSNAKEAGIDQGGPSREFGCLFTKQLVTSNEYISGPYGFKIRQDYLESLDYARIGRLAAMIIINTGLPVPIFGKPMAEFIILGALQSDLTTDDFPPGRSRAIAEQIIKAEINELDNIDGFDREQLGIVVPTLHEEHRQILLRAHFSATVAGAQIGPIRQFVEGFRLGGVLPLLVEVGPAAVEVLEIRKFKMTEGDFLALFNHLPCDEAVRHDEEVCYSNFTFWLKSVMKGKQSMSAITLDEALECTTEPTTANTTLTAEDVLIFFTGATHPPLTGFAKYIDISFTSDVQYPRISTCFLEAKFPLNYQGGSNEYQLHARGRRAREKACHCYTRWVFEGPGYGQI